MEFFGRIQELEKIGKLLDTKHSQFMHIRGRRRIGKTSLLERIAEAHHGFYFCGYNDESDLNCRQRFAEHWDRYTNEKVFGEPKTSLLNWERLFDGVTTFAKKNSKEQIVFILDEIQWLAKKNSGILGQLKRTWEDHWQSLGNLKLLASGSSSKFFLQHVDNKKGVLFGIRTVADLHLQEFTLKELEQFFFKDYGWTREQICLIYMMTGGVPYYINQIRRAAEEDENYFRAINKALFCSSTIFLDEIDNILFLELRAGQAIVNAKKILRSFGQDGATEKTICEKSGLPESTTRTLLVKLLDYEIVFERKTFNQTPSQNRKGTRYYTKDHFINFYFQILEPRRRFIQDNNNDAMLFNGSVITSNTGFYVPNFSGKAFELLLFNFLSDVKNRNTRLFKKLRIENKQYEVSTYWKHNLFQMDIIVESREDKELRIIEAKWINQQVEALSVYINQLQIKAVQLPNHYRVVQYLICSNGYTAAFFNSVPKEVVLLKLDDLFE